MENITEKYLNRFNELIKRNNHLQSGDFLIVDSYVNINTKMLCEDKYGLLLVPPESLIKGYKPTIPSAINKDEYLINKFREVHGDRYDYSLVEYVNSKTKVKIICKDHGIFNQVLSSHLMGSGCPDCGRILCNSKRSIGKGAFLERAREVHGDTYEYDNIQENISFKDKVEIQCSLHGVFKQTVGSHLIGRGCRKCGNNVLKLQRQGQPNTWKLSGWYDKAINSVNFDSYKFYLLRFFNDEEEFIKSGITFLKIGGRYHSRLTRGCYDYEVLKVVERVNKEDFEGCKYIFELERRFQNIWKKHKYQPLCNFNGENECFNNNKDVADAIVIAEAGLKKFKKESLDSNI